MIANTFPSCTDPWLAHEVVIDRITPEVERVATYHLRFTDPKTAAAYRFLPGQFNMLYLPGVGEAAISVSANPRSRESWAHTIRLAGNVTHTLGQLGVGGSLGLRGPFGSHWPVELASGRDLVLVAGGIGLPPLRPVIYDVVSRRDAFRDVTVLYGSRTPDFLVYVNEYDAWRAQKIDVRLTVDRTAPGWEGNVGVVPLLLDRLTLRDPAETVVFTCGPEVMMRYAAKSALKQGIPEENIWLSMERNMQCAVGLCGHCQLGPAFICRDGPVFRHDKIEPFMTVESL
ncbi:MAG: FAD/NAD(P)-binding protein [Deltaproteobacteria bacterium]